MESTNFYFFIILGSFGVLSNLATLVYILMNFQIRTHVYSLLFIDSLISSIGAILLTSLDILVQSGLLNISYAYCSVTFFSMFLPVFYGGFLTFMVALIRYVLAMKSAKNIQVQNSAVSKRSLSSFSVLVLLTLCYSAYNIWFDIPFAVFVESCFSGKGEPRPVTLTNIIANRTGVIMNLASVFVDILVVRFIKKTILPVNNHQVLTSHIISAK